MKSLFKTMCLVSTIVLNSSPVLANDAKTTPPKTYNDNQRSAYALGALFGFYIDNTLMQQKALGINLDQKQLLAGLQDVFRKELKLNYQEITTILKTIENKIRTAAQAKIEQEINHNRQLSDQYRLKYLQVEPQAIKTKSGLIYKIDQPGEGQEPKDNDLVVVNYEGSFIDGSVFDSSYQRKQPLTIALADVLPGWKEGLKLLKPGGKIHMIIPPELSYGNSATSYITANSTLIFKVELLDIKITK